MKVVSVNVGLPRDVEWQGKTVQTSIWKLPVEGSVRVGTTNLDGDRQSDLSVHGGVFKAVYVYPSEHYTNWRNELGEMELPWGAFGENLTTEGLLEHAVCSGDRLRIGSAEFVVTQPRMPCFKLGIRFDRPDILKRFLDSGRSGFYLSIVREGALRAGDAITLAAGAGDRVSVSELASLYIADDGDEALLRRVSELSTLSEGWRERFRKRLGVSALGREPNTF